MKFLVDHQLPPGLARLLEHEGHFAQHVREIGLMEADDTIIWRHAITNGMVVVSKDEDFYFLALAPDNIGKLVWVRIGNCRKQALFALFQNRLAQIVAAFEAGSDIVELR